MAKRRGKRSRRQRRILNPHRKIQQVIEGADFINSMPDEIHREIQQVIEGADFINSMPDEILNHILSFIPIDLAIRTSVLSRRWRHAWCELPCLHLRTTAKGIDQTLLSYRRLKIMSFKLCVTHEVTEPQFNSWVEFAMSRNVGELSLTGLLFCFETYGFPDCFYLSSSLRQLNLVGFDMRPGCTVSWNFLRRLTLSCCSLYDESIANILSGSPNLETLQLFYCDGLLKRLDLSKSPSLSALEIYGWSQRSGQMEIVAPHIHYLNLKNSDVGPCTLVDVSSLADAILRIGLNRYRPFMAGFQQYADVLQTMVLKMLAKLQNVERLTFRGGYLLQILSLAMLCGVRLPKLKVQTLTVQTNFARSVIPSIARLLQNSPGLKNLEVHATYVSYIEDADLDEYLRISHGLDSDTCWRSKHEVFPTHETLRFMSDCNGAKMRLLGSFLRLVLRNAKRLEKIVVWLGDSYFSDEQMERLLMVVGTLSPNNNVSIEFK
ncbi:hypothetical protein HID58_008145 [Brassica napus]|uniref:F-box domain-containing protein n=2 Tax=Brassica TaxID=3705 RepID=A0A8D9DK27_BRACM|nr:putative F-box/LRR-repeat protein At5g02700 [Brassica napus]KAH0931028.1 hypothetical protein HID58_008145 [Brassica napus]CAF2118229.1 unnamed protein product [Brassica napus]CAG7878752.1 unnamed protein product [Brassica rapa]